MEIDENEKNIVINYIKKYNLYEFLKQLFFKQHNWPDLKKYGHLKIIKWLSSLDLNWDIEVCNLLVKQHALASLKYLHRNGHDIIISPDIFIDVCRDRNLKMLQFLHENKSFNINSAIPMTEAARSNHDKTVIFLYENGYNYTSLVNEWAFYYKNYDLLQYLYEKNNKKNTKYSVYLVLSIIFTIAILTYTY